MTIDFSADDYRLLTEAEWEYAAKGRSKSRELQYSGSNNLNEVGWSFENSGAKPLLSKSYSSKQVIINDCKNHPIGLKKDNELGIYDMSGNVWEWCWDANKQNAYGIYRRVCNGGSYATRED